MRVLCGKVVSSTTGELMESSPWLHVDGEYVVLAIEMVPDRRIFLRLVGDDGEGGPGLYDSEMFVTVSSEIPSTWVVAVREGGGLDLAPQRWLAPGFWEEYFDRGQSAIAIFEEEKAKILSES